MEKKGMSTLAKVGIGCGIVVLLGLIVGGIAAAFLVKKGTEFVAEAEKNPALATAKLLAAADPNVEVVGSDDVAQTVTLKNLQTGQQVTVDLKGLQEGKIAWEDESGRSEISASGEQVSISGSDGSTATFAAGSGQIPAWVPTYPNGQANGISSFSNNESDGGLFTVTTTDPAEQASTWYQEELKKLGFVIEGTSLNTTGTTVAAVFSATNEATQQSIGFLAAQENGSTQVSITHNHSKVVPAP